MKFICLGYYDEAAWNAMPESDRSSFVDACLAYDAELKRAGRVLGGEALRGADSAVTVRMRDGQVAVTDGPFAETKEQIGGILIIDARDLNHAIQIMSKHPGVKAGPFEIRPVDEEFTRMAAERMEAMGL